MKISCLLHSNVLQIITFSYKDFQDYTYYFVPAPWLSVKLLRLLQNYPPPDDPGVRGRLNECLETILNKAQEPPKSKKVQHSNAKNSVLFEAISLIIHNDRYAPTVWKGEKFTLKKTKFREISFKCVWFSTSSK